MHILSIAGFVGYLSFLNLLGIFLLWFYLLLGAFLIYASVHRKWKQLKPYQKIILGPFIILYPIDVGFNIVFGTLMFMELPRQLTFSARCSQHMNDTDWRGTLARFFCNNLNFFDPGHCK